MSDSSSLSDRLARLYTGIVFDVMRSLGLITGVLPPEIVALEPGQRVAGCVWTVHGTMVDDVSAHDSLLDWTRMLSRAPQDAVVVCQPENHEIALMGELSAEALTLRGVRGYVVDGGCRDSAFIRRLGFPVFCRFTTPKDVVARWRTDELGGSVRIGGARVRTGDYLLADEDGIVIIPAEIVVEVIDAAEHAVTVENKVRAAILAGSDPEHAYLEFGKF